MNRMDLYGGKRLQLAPLMGLPGIPLTKTTVRQNLESAETQWQSLSRLYERFSPDAMFTMMDLSVEAEALGIELLRPENGSYTVAVHPVTSREVLQELAVPRPRQDGRMPLMLEVMRLMSRYLDCLRVAYVIGPFTLAGLLAGAGRVIKGVIKNQEFLLRLLDFSCQVIHAYAEALAEAGADMICLLEPTASALSPEQFRLFSGVHIQRLADGCPVPVILHICGNTTALIEVMLATGCRGLSLDSQVDLAAVSRLIPQDRYIFGNLDPVRTVAYGSRAQVVDETRTLLGSMAGYDNFVLSTGCDLPLDTRLENLEGLCSAARECCGNRKP